jgi:3-oxoacyl-[acyl-carrier-protein] synthase III
MNSPLFPHHRHRQLPAAAPRQQRDLAAQLAADGVETSDDWIVERTGIRARHFADDGVTSQRPGACTRRATRWRPPAAGRDRST